MTIVAVFLAPLVGLGLIMLLEHVERWAFDNDELITAARRRAAVMSTVPTRSASAARNLS